MRESHGAIHRATLRGGYVVAVRVADRFDPLLDILRGCGAIDADGWYAAMEALGRSDRRAGDLALDVAGASPMAVHHALRAQARRRLEVMGERARRGGSCVSFRTRRVAAGEIATRLSLGDLPAPTPRRRPVSPAPRSARERRPSSPGTRVAPAPAPTRGDPPIGRRELRRLAFELHPDRNLHLDAPSRERLARRLAELTAAYHGLRR